MTSLHADALVSSGPMASFPGGEQSVFRFANGYGASVIRHSGSYGGPSGLWELGVIKWGQDDEADDWHLTYETPVTDDVIGYLSTLDVDNLLSQIAALPAVTP